MRTWLSLAVVALAAVPLLSVGGVEGTMEYAMDAPWRIEPHVKEDGEVEYGLIPIQVSIHDTELIDLDPLALMDAISLGIPPSQVTKFSQFCSLLVEEKGSNVNRRRRFELDDLAEIEKSGRWRSPSSPAPLHRVCRPTDAADRCVSVRGLFDSAEWHALAWYPPATRVPGSDISLTLTATVTKDRARCSAADEFNVVTLRNHVTVHLGEAPMPRFDNRWLLGDLHYHSQGTDNEGESAYNYGGVIRAMGALGLDFVLAAEHASNSRQVIDADIKHSWCGVEGRQNDAALRDMSVERFRYLNERVLRAAGGVNRAAALDAGSGRLPQGYLSHRVIPQIFLGGEIDAIPETETDGRYIPYGNGKAPFDTNDLQEGWQSEAQWCNFPAKPPLFELAANGWLVKDVQGLNSLDYGREHLIYLPGVGTDVNAFVASNTGIYGGAGRRLAERHQGQAPLLEEIARKKGYAFLAHPLNAGEGDKGPDGPPWSEFMIRKAWSSPAVLGLQFWNEPTHLRTKLDDRARDAAEEGYDFTGNFFDRSAGVAEAQRLGFARGRFELKPYYAVTRPFAFWSYGVESALHHGAFTWDGWLLRGLDSDETSRLEWLRPGEPRRFFIAAGSDAHGDLNYRRTGYFLGTASITDVAIGKARNLVFAGEPTLPRDENIPPEWAGKPAERHSHAQVVRAIAAGNFAATDGPALRIVVDRNRNGQIDDTDTPMGGIVALPGDDDLPVIVEWRSTPEFRGLTRLELYVGVGNDAAGAGSGRVYAPALHGPRNFADVPGDTVMASYNHSGRTYARMQDNYWRDPTGLLRIRITPSNRFAGTAVVRLPLAAFEARFRAPGGRFFVRAFAETAAKDPVGCTTSLAANGRGACIRHYAFTNPIWAIAPPSPARQPGRVATSPRY